VEIKTSIKLNLIYLMGIFYKSRFKKYKNKKKIILTLTPRHKNMGDHAIAIASKKFIEENFKDYEFLELDMHDIYKYGRALKSYLTPEDIVMILGGGNMGDMYLNDENQRRFIIKKFKNNRIVSLPQTIDFSNTENGKKELEKTKKIYNSHKNLLLVAREEKSFEIMKSFFGESRVIKSPDMVLYLDEKKTGKRDGVLLCLRKDKEGVLPEKFEKSITASLIKKYKVVKTMDTVLEENQDKSTREIKLKKIITEIGRSKLVITDRLHGMIFCVITGTPCIVLETFNHKVTGVYKWLEKLDYIKMVNHEKLLDSLLDICDETINSNKEKLSFSDDFNKLSKSVLGTDIK
jgi:pyruvyl transferase EpsI